MNTLRFSYERYVSIGLSGIHVISEIENIGRYIWEKIKSENKTHKDVNFDIDKHRVCYIKRVMRGE